MTLCSQKTKLCIALSSVVLSVLATNPPTSAQTRSFGKPELLHGWTRMDYVWRSAAEQAAYTNDGVYKAATLAGVDVDRKGNLYVTTPRWIDKRVPSTLSQVVSVNGKSVLLTRFTQPMSMYC